jgi:4-amino-4-deoxy-L-arabinose transferase-like glycosyltransferase
MKMKNLLLAGAVVCLYFWGLGGHGLIDPDEGRYAEIPREMIETGDFVTPRLNYVKYFEKPVLHYWFTAAAFAAFGQSEFAARLTPALCALGGIFVTFVLARRLSPPILYPRADFYSSVILSTCLLWFAIARLNILDMTVSFFITLSLAGFWFGQNGDGRNRRCLLLFYAGMALATLTKGLIGIVLPGGIVFCYILLTRQWKQIPHTLYLPGIVLFFVLTVPWFWAVCRANGDFFHFFFIQEHFLRYTTQMHGRYQPVWFFIPVLAGGLVPWAGLLPDMAREAICRAGDESSSKLFQTELSRSKLSGSKLSSSKLSSSKLFLCLWFAVPFVFFSLSSSKLIPYILPCLPPLAILGGRALSRIAKGDEAYAGRFVHVNGVLLLLLAAAGVLYPLADKKLEAAILYPYTLPAAAALAVFALCEWKLYSRGLYKGMVNAACVLAFVNVLFFSRGFALKAEEDSYREPAAAIQESLRPGDEVVSYKNLAQGLGFYLKRRIVLADARGELEFGAGQEKDPRWFIGSQALETLWNGEGRVFLVAEARHIKELEHLLRGNNWIRLYQDRNNVVLSNAEQAKNPGRYGQ